MFGQNALHQDGTVKRMGVPIVFMVALPAEATKHQGSMFGSW
jgi:hypothetical protein